jgi:hypothetical protein
MMMILTNHLSSKCYDYHGIFVNGNIKTFKELNDYSIPNVILGYIFSKGNID